MLASPFRSARLNFLDIVLTHTNTQDIRRDFMATIPYGYVYEIVNKINGKTYVGSRKLAKDKSWRQYMGSGRLIKSAIAKHGKENFVKRFLAYADSEASLCSKEWDLISSRRSNGYCQYNLFLGPGAGGDTFSRLKSKTLDEVKKAQSEGMKNSELVRRTAERRVASKQAKICAFASKNKDSVVKMYSEGQAIVDLARYFGVPRLYIRESLVSFGVTLNDRTVEGVIMPKDQKESISESLRRNFLGGPEYIGPLPCPTRLRSKLAYRKCVTCRSLFKERKKQEYCLDCSKKQKQSKSFSISYEDAYRIWVVERGRISDIEDFVGCKSRTASYLLEGHGLPTTMRSRDKLREELNLD